MEYLLPFVLGADTALAFVEGSERFVVPFVMVFALVLLLAYLALRTWPR